MSLVASSVLLPKLILRTLGRIINEQHRFKYLHEAVIDVANATLLLSPFNLMSLFTSEGRHRAS
jgi:hypothetical protein